MDMKFFSSLFLPLWAFFFFWQRIFLQICDKSTESGIINIYLRWLKNVALQIWRSMCNIRLISYTQPCSLLKADTAAVRSCFPRKTWLKSLKPMSLVPPTLWDTPALFQLPEILETAQSLWLMITKNWCLKLRASYNLEHECVLGNVI